MVHNSNVPNPIKNNLFANLGAIIEQMAEYNPGNPEAEIERLRALIRRNEEEFQALQAQNQSISSSSESGSSSSESISSSSESGSSSSESESSSSESTSHKYN